MRGQNEYFETTKWKKLPVQMFTSPIKGTRNRLREALQFGLATTQATGNAVRSFRQYLEEQKQRRNMPKGDDVVSHSVSRTNRPFTLPERQPPKVDALYQHVTHEREIKAEQQNPNPINPSVYRHRTAARAVSRKAKEEVDETARESAYQEQRRASRQQRRAKRIEKSEPTTEISIAVGGIHKIKVKKPVAKPVKKPVKKPLKKPLKKLVKKPVVKSTKKKVATTHSRK